MNLPLVLVVVSLLFASFNFGLTLALGSGIVLDILSGLPDGVFAIAFVLVFLLLYFIVHNILTKEPNMLILFSAVAAGTLVYYILMIGITEFFSFFGSRHLIDVKGVLIMDLAKNLIFNLVFTYPVLQVYLWIEKLTQKITKPNAQSI
jgi:hypothetical protein